MLQRLEYDKWKDNVANMSPPAYFTTKKTEKVIFYET